MAKAAVLAVALLLSACATTHEEVLVPVATIATPPAELSKKFNPDRRPVAVSPAEPGAVIAFTQDGANALMQLIADLYGRVAGWEAWAGVR